jgi:hypothetical protein
MADKYSADKFSKDTDPDLYQDNRDAITGAPGSHPLGTGIGAVSAGAAGAAIGSAAGPAGSIVGAAIGVVVGAVAGGLVGKGVAEAISPTDEDAYWRESYKTRPYVPSGALYESYQPAYRHGWEARSKFSGKGFDDIEGNLRGEWERRKYPDNLTWEQARDAARDAYERPTDARPMDPADQTSIDTTIDETEIEILHIPQEEGGASGVGATPTGTERGTSESATNFESHASASSDRGDRTPDVERGDELA